MYFFIQTEIFNKWALQFTLDKLNQDSQTNGININADSIQGNILHGLILKKGGIKIENNTLFSFSYIDLKYDLSELIEHEIRINNITINSPEINLSKIKDNNDSIVWNISKLFTSSQEPDTAESVFDWGVVIENLKIENGSMNVEGQLSSEMPEWRRQMQMMKEFDFNNLEVKNLELELSGRYFTDHKNISIRNLYFNSNSDFNVRKLMMTYNFNIIDTTSELQNLELITDKSDIKINKARMSGFNPIDSSPFKNIKDKSIEADLDIRKFSFADLRFFIPSVDMLDSTVGLILNVNGKYGDININRLNLMLPNSEINLTGKLKKLDEPENLYMDVHIKESRIFPKDVITVVKVSSIPDYNNIGTIYPEIIYTGTYKKFQSEYDIITSAGNVSGHINMDLPAEKYSGRIVVVNLNQGKILKDNSLNGHINLSADFAGSSFDPSTINAEVKYQMGNSNIAGYDVRSSAGNISLNGKNVKLNIRHSSSMGNVLVKGSINLSNPENPGYKLSGSVSNLNVASITKSPDDRSNVNFSFDIDGKGITPDNLNGKYNLSILPSVYGSNVIPQTMLTLNVRNSESENIIDIVSDIADFKARGKFKIKDVINAVLYNAAAASENLSSKLKLDFVHKPETGISDIDNFTLEYSLAVKDFAKTSTLLTPFDIKFNGSSSGHLENNFNGFNFSSILDFPNFYYKDSLLVLNNFTTNVFFSNDYVNSSGNNLLENIELNIKTQNGKVMFKDSNFDSVNVLFKINNSVADFAAEIKDSIMPANLNGIINLNSDSIVCTIDTLSLKYNRYNLKNSGDWILSYLPDESIRIQQMKLGSKGADINISGNYSLNSSSDIRIEGNDMRVRDLINEFYSIDTSGLIKLNNYPVEGLLNTLSVNYKGTLSDPELNVIVNSSELKYDGRAFGKIKINSSYNDENALLDIFLIDEISNGKLTINGNLPLENLMSSDSAKMKSANNNVYLKVNAENFEYKYFLKLIPGMPSLGGVMNGELITEGNVSSPDLKGSMVIKGGNFFFDYTGMNYSYDLHTSTENSKLVIDTLKLYNANDESKNIDIKGKIDLAGMKLNDIDLVSSGDIMLLDKNVKWNELGIYGYILAGISSPAVSIKGNLDRLKISGQLVTRDADVSILPKGNKGYDIKNDNFRYFLRKQDSNIVNAGNIIPVPEEEYHMLEPFKKSNYMIDKKKSAKAGFLDINVDIKTLKNINASINFGKILAKLNGEIKADLNLKTENEELKAIGKVDVVGNSYFRFYKDFKLKSSEIIFDGKLEDPLLNIQAIHTGTKVSEQYGNSASSEVQVKLTVTGRAGDPKVKLALIENGTELSGDNVQADVVSYLIYGKFKSELTESERTSVAAAIGVAYVSSYVIDLMGEIFPILSEATFTVGDKPLKELKNFEFSIDYPLNNILNLYIPETLMMQFFREELDDIFSTTQTTMNTGMKIFYKIKF